MRLSTIRAIQLKNPTFSIDEIKRVVGNYLKTISNRISNNTTVNINVPKLGRIHTHGNAINSSYKARLVRHKKWRDNKADFSDKTLLF